MYCLNFEQLKTQNNMLKIILPDGRVSANLKFFKIILLLLNLLLMLYVTVLEVCFCIKRKVYVGFKSFIIFFICKISQKSLLQILLL